MDSIVHQLITRLNMFLLQELDFEADLARCGTDPEYIAQVLDLAMELQHGEIRLLARQIRDRQIQLLSLHASTVRASPEQTAQLPAATDPPARQPGRD